MLAANIGFVAEENLHNLSGLFSRLLTIFWLDELADHGNVQGPNQIGHKHKGILQNGQSLNGLSPIVVRDVAAQFPYAFLNLFGRNNLAK
jgi:hypothetical protein